jgi:ferrous iron transport protein B
MAPFTVWWLGLPAITGIFLILGLVRKELILLGAVTIFGSPNLALFLTPVQLVTLAFVGMIYFPCISVFTMLTKEFGWKPAITISIANILSAILLGGLAFRLLQLFL